MWLIFHFVCNRYSLEEILNFLHFSTGRNFLYTFLHISCYFSGQVYESVQDITPCTKCRKDEISQEMCRIYGLHLTCTAAGNLDFRPVIAFGTNPSFQVYKQAEMRQHLLKCFEQKKMEPFPAYVQNRTLKSSFKFIPVKVYCHCRRTDHYGNEMICCEGQCNEWFHLECLELPHFCSNQHGCVQIVHSN